MTFYHPVLLTLLLGLSGSALAADFTAGARQGSTGGEPITLRLELTDAKATSQPDLSAVETSFQILGEEQSAVTRILNGVSSFSTIWELNLLPVGPDRNVIPPIKIATTEGELSTNPVPIQPQARAVARATSTPAPGLTFVAKANKDDPYKNEAVLITYKLTSDQPLRSIELSDLKVKDAIVERQGEPKVQTDSTHGGDRQTLSVSYTVTPMRDGTLTIPPLSVRGQVLVPRTNPALIDGFGDDDDAGGPFAAMQRMMANFSREADMLGGFGSTKTVALASNGITLKVLPAAPGMDPWLPATSLKLSQSWQGVEKARVGEPLTRTITTQATGIASTQLPGFETQFNESSTYKAYSDQPELSTKQDHGQIVAVRKDQYTVVPREAGDIHLPGLTVAWWDTKTHSKQIASLPAKVIHVAPGAAALSAAAPTAPSDSSQGATPVVANATPSANRNFTSLLAIACTMAAVLLFVGGWFLYRGKLRTHTRHAAEVKHPVVQFDKAALKKCSSVKEVYQFLQNYAELRWQTPPNASLGRIFATAAREDIDFESTKAATLMGLIDGALYADKPIDLPSLRQELCELLFVRRRQTSGTRSAVGLPQLNPT